MEENSDKKTTRPTVRMRIVKELKAGVSAKEIAKRHKVSYRTVLNIRRWMKAAGDKMAAYDFHNQSAPVYLTQAEDAFLRDQHDRATLHHPDRDRTPTAYPGLSLINRVLSELFPGLSRKNLNAAKRILISARLGFEHGKAPDYPPVLRGAFFELDEKKFGERVLAFAAVDGLSGRLFWRNTCGTLEDGYIAFLEHLNKAAPEGKRIFLNMNAGGSFMKTDKVLQTLESFEEGRFAITITERIDPMEAMAVILALLLIETSVENGRNRKRTVSQVVQEVFERLANAFRAAMLSLGTPWKSRNKV